MSDEVKASRLPQLKSGEEWLSKPRYQSKLNVLDIESLQLPLRKKEVYSEPLVKALADACGIKLPGNLYAPAGLYLVQGPSLASKSTFFREKIIPSLLTNKIKAGFVAMSEPEWDEKDVAAADCKETLSSVLLSLTETDHDVVLVDSFRDLVFLEGGSTWSGGVNPALIAALINLDRRYAAAGKAVIAIFNPLLAWSHSLATAVTGVVQGTVTLGDESVLSMRAVQVQGERITPHRVYTRFTSESDNVADHTALAYQLMGLLEDDANG